MYPKYRAGELEVTAAGIVRDHAMSGTVEYRAAPRRVDTEGNVIPIISFMDWVRSATLRLNVDGQRDRDRLKLWT